jgi:hypothetical protein
MKVTGEPGWHFIDLIRIYKGAETRPNTPRILQLTYAADHPGETRSPSFRFEVTADDSVLVGR